MRKILILTGRYLPGFKDGGPVRSILNLTEWFGEEYDIRIMCLDRDHGDEKPYDGIKINEINHAGKADIYYSGEGKFSFSEIKKLINDSDFAYVCGIYNNYAIRSMILYRFGMIKCPFVVAPMGSFSKGALAIKSTKKQLFLKAMKLLGLFKDVAFSVTSEVEMEELREALNISNKCYIAKDPQRKPLQAKEEREYKQGDKLNIVFLSRINEKKNLLGAISILSKVKSEVVFHIYGNSFFNITVKNYFSFFKNNNSVTELADCIHLVTDKKDSSAAFCNIKHFIYAFFLKSCISYSKNLINKQYVRFKICRNSKRKADKHTA